MKTLRITSKDVKDTNYYWKEYIGKTDVSDFDGHIEIEGNLGYIKFDSIKTSGHILAEAGTGIKAGWGIEAGEGIEAGWGIEAGEGIEAGTGIKAGWGIEAGEGIEAGWGIEAGRGIEAGWGIEAGRGIEAGEGIEAGWSINCKLKLNIGLRIFAGLCLWRKPTIDETKIICGKLENGEVCYGNLEEIGLPDNKKEELNLSGKEVKVSLDGIDYVAVIK